MPRHLRRLLQFGSVGLFLLAGLAGSALAGDDSTEITTISATVYNGYARTKAPDGSFTPETYSFGKGGITGRPTKDSSVDEQSFLKIAGAIAPGLARQGYVASFDPESTRLLILVYWGATGTEQNASMGADTGPSAVMPSPPPPPVVVSGGVVDSGPTQPVPIDESKQWASDVMTSARNQARDRDNFQNARILGYAEELVQASRRPSGYLYRDLVEEIEDPRYFVVLMAYDFQLIRQEKKPKLLWEVHYSLRARGHRFDESLAAMTDMASRYFGQDSKGLVRREVPVGHVEMKDLIFKDYTAPTEKK